MKVIYVDLNILKPGKYIEQFMAVNCYGKVIQ